MAASKDGKPVKDDKSVGRLLTIASRLHRTRIGEKIAALSLFPGQEQVIEALARDGSMAMGELAALLSVRPPTVSKTIARLSTQGLVTRTADDGDGRMVRVQLTEAGLERAEALGGLMREVEAEMLAAFDGKDRKRLRKLLRRAVKAMATAGDRTTDAGDDEPDEDDA